MTLLQTYSRLPKDEKTLTIHATEASLTITKNDTENRCVSDHSIMPEDQWRAFSPEEIRSLMAYLRTET